jgi:uncharacterized protein
MRSPLGAFIFAVIVILLDAYVFQAIKVVSHSASPKTKMILNVAYWLLTFLVIISFLLFAFTSKDFLPKTIRMYLFATILGIFFAKFIAAIFLLLDDIRRLAQLIFGKLFYFTVGDPMNEDGISRSVFLSWLGLAAGGGLFGTLIYGYSNKYNYTIKRVDLSFDSLPEGFKGLRILHISDIHSGSFTNKKAVLHGVQMILNEKADIILFTGDLVNDLATEMKDYMDVFSLLKAPMGVYSTLGNHDYGDYVTWPNGGITKEQNLENVKKVHAALGWRLLMNEHVILERNENQIALLGVENWSAKARFPKHGRMDLAYPGSEEYPFKILMSHDPSHWDAQVKPKYGDIDLTLSGHTHGMQFGVEIPGFKWSPVQYMYKEWGGLYEDGKQKLYVNRGYGFIGYPGRVGIMPEITVITLT